MWQRATDFIWSYPGRRRCRRRLRRRSPQNRKHLEFGCGRHVIVFHLQVVQTPPPLPLQQPMGAQYGSAPSNAGFPSSAGERRPGSSPGPLLYRSRLSGARDITGNP